MLRLNNEASQFGIAIHGCRYCKTKKIKKIKKRARGGGGGEERKDLAHIVCLSFAQFFKKVLARLSSKTNSKFLQSGLSRSRFPIDPVHAFARFELATRLPHGRAQLWDR